MYPYALLSSAVIAFTAAPVAAAAPAPATATADTSAHEPAAAHESAAAGSDASVAAERRAQSVSPFIFDNGPDYLSEGMYRVVDEHGRMGFANARHQVVIAPQFSFALPFEHGQAKVTLKGKARCDSVGCEHWYWDSDDWFCIDVRGSEVKCRSDLTGMHVDPQPSSLYGTDDQRHFVLSITPSLSASDKRRSGLSPGNDSPHGLSHGNDSRHGLSSSDDGRP
ncbi:WG repeat-containing protein [Anaerobiospirillum sp. NML120449]|uniref:WG repeat-containing protein n=1 Tax=Anaerobiospirillum sp. NML120449 TaxID=2932817 RepID=UPI001FF4FF8B|nr:WG repeat-containing protein [Anaerobiospirillum sp. NML120449]MCK0527639.1 WG repeat-containing protein [Anaerobiospirillum sp. NML120449]